MKQWCISARQLKNFIDKTERTKNLQSIAVGKERVEFNAHRIFYASTVIDSFSEMELREFSVGLGYEIDADIKDIHKYDTYDVKGAGRFGLFYFVKK